MDFEQLVTSQLKDESSCVTYKWASNHLNVSSKYGEMALHGYQTNNSSTCDGVYLVGGIVNSSPCQSDFKMKPIQFSLISSKQVDQAKQNNLEGFESISSLHCYSIIPNASPESNSLIHASNISMNRKLADGEFLKFHRSSAISCKEVLFTPRKKIAGGSSSSSAPPPMSKSTNASSGSITAGSKKLEPTSAKNFFGAAAAGKSKSSTSAAATAKKTTAATKSLFGTSKSKPSASKKNEPEKTEKAEEEVAPANEVKKKRKQIVDSDDDGLADSDEEVKPKKKSPTKSKAKSPTKKSPPKRKAKASASTLNEADSDDESDDGYNSDHLKKKKGKDAEGDDDDDFSKTYGAMDSFVKSPVKNNMIKKKKLVEKTYMDDKGYLVTENVWEEVEEEASPVKKAKSPVKPTKTTNTAAESSAAPKKAKPTNQKSMLSFFAKKK